MKDKIKEVIAKSRSSVPFWELSVAEQEEINNESQAILDLIAKELPKERDDKWGSEFLENIRFERKIGYNQYRKELLHKLEVE